MPIGCDGFMRSLAASFIEYHDDKCSDRIARLWVSGEPSKKRRWR